MKIFGFYRDDAYGLDLSYLSFFPKAKRSILVGERIFEGELTGGYVYGFKGLILIYEDMEGFEILIDRHMFMTHSGFFSDSLYYLHIVGVPVDYESCKKFIENGYFEGFSPLKYTYVLGSKVKVIIGDGKVDFITLESEPLSLVQSKPKDFKIIPKIYGKFWKLRILFGKEKRKRAYSVENWFSPDHSS